MQRDCFSAFGKLPTGLATRHQIHIDAITAFARARQNGPLRFSAAHNVEVALYPLWNLRHALDLHDPLDALPPPEGAPKLPDVTEQVHSIRHVMSINGRVSPRPQNARSPQKHSGREGLLFRRTVVLSNK